MRPLLSLSLNRFSVRYSGICNPHHAKLVPIKHWGIHDYLTSSLNIQIRKWVNEDRLLNTNNMITRLDFRIIIFFLCPSMDYLNIGQGPYRINWWDFWIRLQKDNIRSDLLTYDHQYRPPNRSSSIQVILMDWSILQGSCWWTLIAIWRKLTP